MFKKVVNKGVIAPGLGPGGRKFESCHPDELDLSIYFEGFFCAFYVEIYPFEEERAQTKGSPI